jgi:hypothetical protein
VVLKIIEIIVFLIRNQGSETELSILVDGNKINTTANPNIIILNP